MTGFPHIFTHCLVANPNCPDSQKKHGSYSHDMRIYKVGAIIWILISENENMLELRHYPQRDALDATVFTSVKTNLFG